MAVMTKTAAAGTCTADEIATTDSLYLWAASTVDCYIWSVTTTTSADIYWTCSDLNCAHVMRQVGDELPDCDYFDGVSVTGNKKQEIASKLSTCGICTSAEEDETSALYKAAAGDPRCAAESSVIDDAVEINWTCGTSCQTVMEDLANKVPDCMMTIGSNEKSDLTQSTGSCSSGGLFGSDFTPSPSTEGSSTSAPETTTSTPLWGTTTGSGSSWLTGDAGDTITAPTFSTESCSSDNLTAMVTAAYDAVNSVDCLAYATISTSQYSVFMAPCYSYCATVLTQLAAYLPDCYYDTQSKNLKEDLTAETDECYALRDRERRSLRSLETESMFSYVTFDFVVPSTFDFGNSSSSSGSNAAVRGAAMANAGALGLLAAVGVAHVLAVL
jgi:hypothetical protein